MSLRVTFNAKDLGGSLGLAAEGGACMMVRTRAGIVSAEPWRALAVEWGDLDKSLGITPGEKGAEPRAGGREPCVPPTKYCQEATVHCCAERLTELTYCNAGLNVQQWSSRWSAYANRAGDV